MKTIEKQVRKELFLLKDEDYKKFTSKLIPTISPDKIIGIRVPALRKFAKDFSKQKESFLYLDLSSHFYFEENNLHAFLIENLKDYNLAMEYTDKFLPNIDNWATCDTFSPKVFKKYPNQVYEKIRKWLKSDEIYTIRYAIGLLLTNFLDENFEKEMLRLVANVKSEEYYVNMMIAWYFATAMAKQPEETLFIIEEKSLSKFVQNKSIQKAKESRRISDETKKYLETLKA